MKTAQAIDRLRQVIRRQHKALATEDTYVFWVGRYIKALRGIPPELTSEKKLELFLTGLALRHNVAASTQNQAFNAVLFFYKEVLGQPLGNVDALRAKRPVHERHAPSVSDTCLLLQTIRNVGGYTNGPGNLARFYSAVGVCVFQGTIFVADYNNQRIRIINFDPSSQPVLPAELVLNTYPGLQISGTVGRTYQIQSSADMTNWNTVATLLLTSSPYLWIDPNAAVGKNFYRAFLLP